MQSAKWLVLLDDNTTTHKPSDLHIKHYVLTHKVEFVRGLQIHYDLVQHIFSICCMV